LEDSARRQRHRGQQHEGGLALLASVLPHGDPLHKVTIIPRGPSLGSTMWLPEEDKYNTRKNELLDSIVVAMGGRVAEEIVFGDVTSGASGDIKMATNIARRMVCEWGMSDNLGMIDYSDGSEQVFLGRDLMRGRDYSEATAQKIDAEIKRLIDGPRTRSVTKTFVEYVADTLDTMVTRGKNAKARGDESVNLDLLNRQIAAFKAVK
jgi:cell division protease FtsH